MNYFLKDTETETYFSGYNEKGFSEWSKEPEKAKSLETHKCWTMIINLRRVGRICEMIPARV